MANEVSVSMTENNIQAVRDALERATEKALEAIGIQAEGYVAEFAPVDTGRLRGSITHAVVPSEQSVYIGTNVEYAVYQELGTSRMTAANGGTGFLRPGIENHMDEYADIARAMFESEGIT